MADKGPINETDDAARALARGLVASARHAALAVLHPVTGAPHVSRVAVGTAEDGTLVTLISGLALHVRALGSDPRASLLLGEPGPKGDPLTHPRLSVSVIAQPVARSAPDHAALRARWLHQHPKSKLYVDFADFGFWRLPATGAALNGGFGKAFALTSDDLKV